MTRLYVLYFFTFVSEMVAGVLPIFWLHGLIAAEFLILAACAGIMFFCLLHLHNTPRQRAYAVYAALYLAAVILYYFLQNHVAHPNSLQLTLNRMTMCMATSNRSPQFKTQCIIDVGA